MTILYNASGDQRYEGGGEDGLFSRSLVWKANYLSRQKVEHYPIIPGVPYSVQPSTQMPEAFLNDVSGHSSENTKVFTFVQTWRQWCTS